MMSKKIHLILFIIMGVSCGYVSSTLEFRVPSVSPLSSIVNRITNTTVGLFRGGLSIFSRTIDRIINTFARVEDRLRELLEEFRRQLVRGIPEFSIPVLDPLHIDKIVFDVAHEAADIKGSAEDVTIKYISKFVVDKEQFSDMGNLRFKLDLNLTFPYIRVDGIYNIDGIIGDTFNIYGNGKFWLNLINLRLATSAIIKFDIPRLKMVALDIDIKLGELENYFDNLMNDPEIGDLFNKVISKIAPEALDILWPDIKGPIQDEILTYINQILDNVTVANLARRLFNIR